MSKILMGEKFMKKVYEDESLPISRGEFKKPSNLSIELDCDDYMMQQGSVTDSTEQIQKFDIDGIQ